MVRERVRVIINADDLGMSEPVNSAVFDALDRGLVSSASLLANGPAFEAAAARIGAFPRAGFGVHLNISEFAPLTEVRSMRGLLRDGHLCERSLALEPVHADAVYEEWCAQVSKVSSFGVPISHLDSHQHFHLRPLLFPVLERVRARFGITRVRTMGAWRAPLGPHRLRALPQIARAWGFRRKLRDAGALTTDGFASVSVFRELAAAGRLRVGTFEVMAHPGNPHHPAYADEMAWLAGDWRRDVGRPVELVSWWRIP